MSLFVGNKTKNYEECFAFGNVDSDCRKHVTNRYYGRYVFLDMAFETNEKGENKYQQYQHRYEKMNED